MTIKHEMRKLLWKLGYDFSRFAPVSHPIARRKSLFRFYDINTVLDIGANSGQFGRELRKEIGFNERILSFEPLSTAFVLLKEHARHDPRWEAFNFAIGDTNEKKEINIAGNSYSSSLLDMLPAHLQSAPESKYVGRETIEIRTLDSIFEGLKAAGNVYMKIDTQGFESKVLKGAGKSLPSIGTVQLEMSLVPLYDGELQFVEMCSLMERKGYNLVALENGFTDDASGQLLQVDGIFRRM